MRPLLGLTLADSIRGETIPETASIRVANVILEYDERRKLKTDFSLWQDGVEMRLKQLDEQHRLQFHVDRMTMDAASIHMFIQQEVLLFFLPCLILVRSFSTVSMDRSEVEAETYHLARAAKFHRWPWPVQLLWRATSLDHKSSSSKHP